MNGVLGGGEAVAKPLSYSRRVSSETTQRKYPMSGDTIIGDGANLTVYERPDRSRYTLDKKGLGAECDHDTPTFGRHRFDSRPLATGRWDGSRSTI